MKDIHKRKIYLEFLNRCGYVGETLPTDAWKILRHADYKKFVAPMIKEDFIHMTEGQLAIKYQLPISKIKYIIYRKR